MLVTEPRYELNLEEDTCYRARIGIMLKEDTDYSVQKGIGFGR